MPSRLRQRRLRQRRRRSRQVVRRRQRQSRNPRMEEVASQSRRRVPRSRLQPRRPSQGQQPRQLRPQPSQVVHPRPSQGQQPSNSRRAIPLAPAVRRHIRDTMVRPRAVPPEIPSPDQAAALVEHRVRQVRQETPKQGQEAHRVPEQASLRPRHRLRDREDSKTIDTKSRCWARMREQ